MSRTTKVITCLLLAMPIVFVSCELAMAGKPAPPPTPIFATTTDRNFLETVVGKLSCQTEFNLAIIVSGTGTHYRYKVGPSATTNPGVLTGYSAPIPKSTPVSFNLTGQADVGYVLCLQGLELDSRGRIKKSQALDQATAYSWTKDTAPVEYRVTFVEPLANSTTTVIYAMDTVGTSVGRSRFRDGMGSVFSHATRWTMPTGLEDISSLDAPWFDLETGLFVEGWIASGAWDINNGGQICGSAYDGLSIRAFVYDDLTGFLLLPRGDEEGTYFANDINENGEVHGSYQPPVGSSLSLFKTFLWSPACPETITFVQPEAYCESFAGMGIGSSTFMLRTNQPNTLELYAFSFPNGVLWHELLDTISVSSGLTEPESSTRLNDGGAFAFVADASTTQAIKLYVPGQPNRTVHESSSYNHEAGNRINNSNDFMYQVDRIPYVYRYRENRSYRLYDLANSVTKTLLFVDSSGAIKNSTVGAFYGVVSDDNAADVPSNDPFDTLSAGLADAQGVKAVVLTPVPRQ